MTLHLIIGAGPAGAATATRLAAHGERIWAEALAAHQAGRTRVTGARASDYFGPGARARNPVDQALSATVSWRRGQGRATA